VISVVRAEESDSCFADALDTWLLEGSSFVEGSGFVESLSPEAISSTLPLPSNTFLVFWVSDLVFRISREFMCVLARLPILPWECEGIASGLKVLGSGSLMDELLSKSVNFVDLISLMMWLRMTVPGAITANPSAAAPLNESGD
jgi:hypothetical protein